MAKNVLVIGGGGRIARHVIHSLAGDAFQLTLFLRDLKKLGDAPGNTRIVQGDALDSTALAEAVRGQDIVYANLSGDNLDHQAAAVIAAMQHADVRRLIFVLSLGIYDEVPGRFGEWNNRVIGEELKPYRRSADAIEASGLDYTILRPAWLTDVDEVDYEITARGELFKGTVVSRSSVADLITRMIRNPSLHIKANLGVNKPNSEAEKPYFM